MKRNVIKIDENLCNGCNECIPNCPEGALQIIDGKARLISDLFCDGLGACIGHCPQGAITIEEREAEAYDEQKVMENIVKQGPNVIKAHLVHLRDHGEHKYVEQALEFLRERKIKFPTSESSGLQEHAHGHSECPGSRIMDFRKELTMKPETQNQHKIESELRQWPVQLMLVPASAPYFNGADLLIAADCCPFAYADFHREFLRGKILLIACPKLDDAEFYLKKLTEIFKNNKIKSVTCVHMEVPCCFGLVQMVKEAMAEVGKKIPFHETTISIQGEKI
ncbi:MAG: 4Fe-4S ferredoxin [Omnitrophica bacterium RIFCSPLOWO2_12_FULL_44_17]|uniref:4Fe-4S ferredoxin n=1 Tax=Candidatus Danuiimicrobium aquiferis TaxID=1801832 RepID=A0A1G1KY26_9BACT|nr:MAG: 4Fe-4S ferredoxin [Omnitrophica bacterium RIFCSPHIGHO2_02_FULL_45_28]OGW89150.1 MAG: 4Fe-4S ferredoxin [Omnitrophica bacterium RIFCSPHIGHO2_12_FULL_44_12]OGW97529.1 MAG: 4Fe-4S ferredoxin [Omnitrophica bacterium RIFCSPLOWO2_12_FULL_44_17]OGX02082.1 MAG: 4Fe-4S ferredoxin [Omnitrophica bacterium RIFCSPLOWO2_02_FULL_44_11]